MSLTIGTDLPGDLLEKISGLLGGTYQPTTPKEDAQLRELAFWRWVAHEGYNDKSPEEFVTFQRELMKGCFERTQWSISDFSAASIFELGCGPMGMIEVIPGAERWAFDPNNDHYGALFGNVRSGDISYIADESVIESVPPVDLGICFNVLDHTDDATSWFRRFFSKIKPSGHFIFQVNTVKEDFPRSEEHQKMHPSPLTSQQVEALLSEVSGDYSHFVQTEPSIDNEFYFMAWGTKRA